MPTQPQVVNHVPVDLAAALGLAVGSFYSLYNDGGSWVRLVELASNQAAPGLDASGVTITPGVSWTIKIEANTRHWVYCIEDGQSSILSVNLAG